MSFSKLSEFPSTPDAFLIVRIIPRASSSIHNFVAPIWKTVALIAFHVAIISVRGTETFCKGTLATRRSLPSWSLTTKPVVCLADEETTKLSKVTLSHPGRGVCQTTKRGELIGSDTHSKRSQFTHGCSIVQSTIFHLCITTVNSCCVTNIAILFSSEKTALF